MRPSTASPIYFYAYFQRILGVAPSTLALRQDTATRTARDSNLDSGNHDMSRLSTLAYLNDSPIHGLTDEPLATTSARAQSLHLDWGASPPGFQLGLGPARGRPWGSRHLSARAQGSLLWSTRDGLT
jgi:hypothetical protein